MTAAVHEIYPPEPDLDVAIEFLKAINPDGRQMLVGQTDESSGPVDTAHRLFEPGMWDEKRALIMAWAAERRNVWVLPNEPKAGGSGKEDDIAFIRCVWSDTDSKAVLADALASSATFVTDSGGGIHTFHTVYPPVEVTPATKALAERVGRGLQHKFAGDAVWNLNRPMRVPGTVNYLNAKKRAKGRQIAKTYVLAFGGGTFTLDELGDLYPAPAAAASTMVGDKEAMAEIDMADVTGNYGALDAGLRQRFEETVVSKTLWINGVQNGDKSGSGHVFQLALRLHGLGFTGTEFAQIAACWTLVDQTNLDHRQLARAWAKAAPSKQAGRVFDDGTPPPEPEPPLPPMVFKPSGADDDEKKLKRRKWLYGRRLLRGYLSSTVAAGGAGKSSLTMAEAVSMASCKDILNVGAAHMPKVPLRVLIWNGEDPQQELDLRLAAIKKHHKVTAADLGGRLFMVSGRDYPIAEAKVMAGFKKAVMDMKIDVVIIDPFVSSHSASENDNQAIDKVAKFWSRLADECDCAVDLAHHIRKPPAGEKMDLTVDDARGASALINASRNARVLVPMPPKMGVSYQVNHRAYFAIQNNATKANMVPGGSGAVWFHFVSVILDNGDPMADPPEEGDNVGVVETWVPTMKITSDPARVKEVQDIVRSGIVAGRKVYDYRMSGQSPDWVGHVVAKALGLDLQEEGNRALVTATIAEWVSQGWLKSKDGVDRKSNPRECVEAGKIPDEFDD